MPTRLVTIAKRIEKIDILIANGCTGHPEDLARAIGISQRSLFEYINLMKENGAPIQFDAKKGTYSYAHEGRFFILFGRVNDLQNH